MIAVLDLQISNLRSVLNAFGRVGADAAVTTEMRDIETADAIVLPGVGAFGNAMASLNRQGIVDLLRRRANTENVPILGICLGMQLLADASEEHGLHRGLGLIPGRVVRLAPNAPGYRVPNIGWYEGRRSAESRLFASIDPAASYYFVHSYHHVCDDPSDVALSVDYGGQRIAAAVERGNVFGVQFHPERSQDAGLDLLARFVALVGQRRRAA